MCCFGFLMFWSGVFLVASNGCAFVYALFAGFPISVVLAHYFGCIYLLHCLKSEVLWQEERRRLESIARERGLANFMDANRTSA